MNSSKSYVRTKYELDEFQSKAFELIDNKTNVLVCAPTGSGKTTVADYGIEQAKQLNPNAKIIYTCPIKALCNEKYRDMVLFWGSNPYNYTIGLMTGDIIINPYGEIKEEQNKSVTDKEEQDEIQTQLESENIIKQNGDIVVMTTEVLQKLMESNDKSKFNPDIIIFDEAHYIGDDSRGHVWEKCIVNTLLNTDALMILLSATIGNVEEINTWLNKICPQKPTVPVIKTIRPVPLRHYFIDCTKSRIFKRITAEADEETRKVSSDPDPESYEILELSDSNYHRVKRYWDRLEEYGYSESFEIETVCNLISSNPNLGIPAIIFVLSKKKCEQIAHSLETDYIDSTTRTEILKFYDLHLREFADYEQYKQVRKVISRGICYHHSGLIPKIREVLEFLIKNKLIKLAFATETFAVGLNFPVKTVVMTSLTKPTERGFRYLTPSEYKQMAGRAGRRFLDLFGNVILMLFNHKPKQRFPYPIWNEISNMVNGQPSRIESKYIIEPNYILKNISSGLDKLISRNSLRFYNQKTNSTNLEVPTKFVKLFEIEKKLIEFAKSGITLKDKNYPKLMSKLSKQEQKEYQNFLSLYRNMTVKNELEQHIELEESIKDFLSANCFIHKSSDTLTGLDLTSKGKIATEFNEINPVIFGNHWTHIMEDSTKIIPILSMFIDDGIKIKEEEIIKWEEIDGGDEIIYWEEQIKLYSQFISKYPKWTYWPKNYFIIKEWIENPTITLDKIVSSHNTDLGLFIKILIKMYQIVDELISKLDKLNMSDLTEKLVEQKELLIRYPLKIDSLYVNL
jgi:superfamily II RNA helicase